MIAASTLIKNTDRTAVVLMNITDTIKPKDRAEWRQWLERHHKTLSEIGLLSDD
jgi:predicted transglutaminase-like cysteine proteinase